ncbi:hypothetical protein [Streptomyces sp. NPDC001927]
MSYVVTVDARVPDGAEELDALQQVGTSTLLERGFDSVEAIEGPDGIEIDVLETIVAVHARGAILKVFVHALSLEIAEHAVGSVAEDVLERSELLADWVVESSEVKLHIDLTRESLEAADGPNAPSSDLETRRAQHKASAAATTSTPAHPANAPAGGGMTDPDVDHEPQIRALAPRLASLAAASFDGIAPETAELAAGALVYATELLVDELYDDVQTLAEEETNVAECDSELWHLGELPPRYALEYDELFARRFLVTTIALTTRFTDGSFLHLGCLAEAVALKLLLGHAEATLDLYGLLDDATTDALDAFASWAYEDTDFEWLYQDSNDDITPLTLGGWFAPLDDGRYVHPYATDEDEQQPDCQ